MFYDPLSVSKEDENAQNILCINDHRQWVRWDKPSFGEMTEISQILTSSRAGSFLI
jgi:hypothetical protein